MVPSLTGTWVRWWIRKVRDGRCSSKDPGKLHILDKQMGEKSSEAQYGSSSAVRYVDPYSRVSYRYITGENHKYGYRNLWCGADALHLASFLNKYQWRIHVIFVYEWPVFLMKLRFGEERTASLSNWMFVSSSEASPKSVLYLGNCNTLCKATLIHEMPHIVSCLGPDCLFWKAYSMDVNCYEQHEMLVSGDA